MSDVTQILCEIEQGDPSAADQLLPLVYDELRKLAARKMALEKPGQTLEATALVHEAYLRLVGGSPVSPSAREGARVRWDSRGHFFAAAAEAMRRILVERARRKRAQKRGGAGERVEVPELADRQQHEQVDLLALDEALRKFEAQDPLKAQVVKLRFFAGCSLEETAQMLGISRATVERHWTYARAWLFGQLNPS